MPRMLLRIRNAHQILLCCTDTQDAPPEEHAQHLGAPGLVRRRDALRD